MKKCPNCEINYIDEKESECEICKKQNNARNVKLTDDNKTQVEKYLIPFLRKLSQKQLESFLQKDESFRLFKLRLPLLIKCENIDKEHCRRERIVDNSNTPRYYTDKYLINGNYYHVCSQWWSFGSEKSKDILQILKELKI